MNPYTSSNVTAAFGRVEFNRHAPFVLARIAIAAGGIGSAQAPSFSSTVESAV